MKSISGALAVLLTALLITSPLAAQPLPADAPVSTNSALQLQLIDQAGSQFRINSHSSKALAVQVTDGAGMPVSDAAVVFRLPDSGATGTFPDGSYSVVKYTDINGRAESPDIQWNATAGQLSIRITAAKGTGHAGLLVDASLVENAPVAVPASSRALAPVITPEPAVEASSSRADAEMGAEQAARSGASGADAPVLPSETPSVSITSASPAGGPHIRMKWVILAAVIAGAGVGAMMALHGTGGNSTTPAASGISIGAPTISIGHP